MLVYYKLLNAIIVLVLLGMDDDECCKFDIMCQLPSVYETWIALAGVQFVLRDVFPHYNQWTFSDERQRVRVQWLCIRIICRVLDVDLKDLIPAHKSIMKMDQNVAHVVPTKNLFANMALHHLLNWEPSIALIHIVSLGIGDAN